MGQGPAAPSGPRSGPQSGQQSGQRSGSPVDVAAPHWLTQLLKPTPAPVDWKRATRAAAAVAGPIAVGVAVGHIALGALVSIGALCGTVTAISGPYRDRARRSGFAVLAGGIGFFLGTLAGEHGWWTVVLIVGAAVVSAVISAAGNVASLAGLQLLVQLVLGTHESTVVGPFTALAGFAVGACWALLLSLAAWPVRATAPERALVAGVFDRLADLLQAAGTPEARAARHRLTAAMNSAYDALLTARSRLQGRDRTYRRLFVVLSEATPAVEAGVAMASARHRPPKSVVDATARVGQAVRADTTVGELDLPEHGSPAVLAFVDGLRTVVDALSGNENEHHAARPARRPRQVRIAAWFDDVLAGPATWRHALRLATCMAIAEVLTVLVPFERSYWLALTVAIVLKPDFGSVFARAVQRGGGTFVGALLGAGVLALDPNGWVLVVLAAAMAFLLPIAQVRQYGMFATVLTPLVIIQLEIGHAGSWDLLAARLVDTVVGCVIVLVFGYLLWPGSRTPRISGRLADAADAVARYADLALRADPHGRSALRRRTYRQLSDLRTEFQRVLAEPSAAGRLAAAWYPAIIGLERVTGSVTRVAVEIDQGAAVPPPSEVDTVVSALRAIATAVRDERQPDDPPTVSSTRLAGVVSHLGLVVAGLRGPDLDRPRPTLRRLLRRGQV
ncbi:MAG TPA: FUSC family protein [Pseudonocardiaceae bacterium]|nr:FUSC family protein [Pseudonocardiaceae bacterium]